MTPTDETQEKQEHELPKAPPTTETVASMELARRPMMEVLSMLSSDAELAKAFAKEVVSQEVARAAFDQDWRLAKVFAMSGVFADITGNTELQAISAAMAKIQLGRSWNLAPADAMQFIYFTNGRPAVMQELFGSKLRDAGYDWDVAYHYAKRPDGKQDCIGCTVYPKRWNSATGKLEAMLMREIVDGQVSEVPLSVSFTKDDADQALIWEKGKQIPLSAKWNFKSWPKDMYFWRALSRFRRQHVTNVLSGVLLRDEAEEIKPPNVIAGQVISVERGSRAAQEAVADEKIEALRRERGVAPGETPEQRDARIERQMAEQLEKAQAADAAKSAPQQGSLMEPLPIYTRDTLPDAESVPEGTECQYDGKIIRAVGEAGEPRSWKTVEVPVAEQPAPKRTPPSFGKKDK